MRQFPVSTTPLRSRVGRRIIVLFVVCALLPTTALTVISYQHVTGQLLKETGVRLRGASKTAGMEILLHLQSVRVGLDRYAAPGGKAEQPGPPGPELLGVGVTEGRAFRLTAGTMRPPPHLPEPQARHVASGRVAILVDTSSNALRILLVRQMNSVTTDSPLLWAEVAPSYIWTSGGAGSLMTEDQDLCVFDSDLRPLACTRPVPSEVVRAAATGRSGSFEWESQAGRYLSGNFKLFLGFDYGAPSWTVIVSEARSDVLAPLASFRRSFFAVVLLALGVVLLLSHGQIRRSLTPLEQLTRGTQRLAAEDFSEPVVVGGEDEFHQLADSFNTMADRLQAQLGALRALHSFDRAALASRDRETVAAATLAAAEGTIGSGAAALALADLQRPGHWRVLQSGPDGAVWQDLELDAEAGRRLAGTVTPVVLPGDDAGLGLLRAAVGHPHSVLLLPLRHGDDLIAALLLGTDGQPADSRRLASAQQLADQVALALSRVQVMEELRELNRGTLVALARAIDANSPWTAGHSERVSAVAVVIGGVLGLPPADLDRLEIGGLLHDVGKIGVSADILNKPARLTDAEMDSVRAHTTLGAGILAPVRAYRDLLPLVRSHHELLDGSGYPDGLAGEQISPLVRVMTVADIFDALVSTRPYRDALPLAEAVALLRQGSGEKLDPQVVVAFLKALGAGHADLWTIYPQLADQLAPGAVPLDEALLTTRWT